eukprot:6465621-Amphidinium_carterae.1
MEPALLHVAMDCVQEDLPRKKKQCIRFLGPLLEQMRGTQLPAARGFASMQEEWDFYLDQVGCAKAHSGGGQMRRELRSDPHTPTQNQAVQKACAKTSKPGWIGRYLVQLAHNGRGGGIRTPFYLKQLYYFSL